MSGSILSLILSLTLLASGAAMGQSLLESGSARDKAIYSELLREFPEEVKNFDQTTESKETVQEFTDAWNALIQKGQALPEKWFKNYSWSQVLQKFAAKISHRSLPVEVKDLRNLSISAAELKGDHSIHDAELYSVQRIGEHISKMAETPDVKTVIYGGSIERLASSLGVSAEHIHVLPSSYGAWGIEKIFVPSVAFADGTARFVMLIPPSKQYLYHYAKMFSYLGEQPEKIILNEADQREQRNKIKLAFESLKKEASTQKLEAVILGYYSVFSQINNGDLVLKKEISIGQGLTTQIVQDLKTKKNYLLIRSDLTIWGESSADIIRGSLVLNPKNVIFMGSAGGITPTTPLYSVSIPHEFYLDGKLLPIKNIVYEQVKNAGKAAEGIVLGGRHGHTNSPIEQTRSYVSGKIKQGITSIDVEQDLIAKLIMEYNKQTKNHIGFGAVNLITDKPQSLDYSWKSDADLTKINHEKKAEARRQAVLSSLTAIRETSELPSLLRCGKVYQ